MPSSHSRADANAGCPSWSYLQCVSLTLLSSCLGLLEQCCTGEPELPHAHQGSVGSLEAACAAKRLTSAWSSPSAPLDPQLARAGHLSASWPPQPAAVACGATQTTSDCTLLQLLKLAVHWCKTCLHKHTSCLVATHHRDPAVWPHIPAPTILM